MRPKSFRLKIALLAGTISAALLVGSGLFLWELVSRFSLDRLDRELRNIGDQNLQREVGPDHWARLERSLEFVSGGADSPPYVLHVRAKGATIFQSPNWPAALVADSFPDPADFGGARPRPRRDPPPPRPGENRFGGERPLPRKFPDFYSRTAEGRHWRIAVMGNPHTTLLLAADIEAFNTDLVRLRNLFLAALPVALLLAAGGAWFLAGRTLRPVIALTRTAEGITAKGLDQRIAVPVHDHEFARLVEVFNSMLDRLEQSFHQATRFSADASHELRTPLARLRVELEQAVAAAPAGSPQQAVFGSLLDEIGHLNAVAQKLLLLSLADAGRLRLEREPVDLARMLENVVEDTQAQAPDLTVDSQLTAGVMVEADAHLLEQVFQNLATNAVKFNQPGGRIRFEMATSPDRISVRVANTGPGIAPADRARLFERFHRADRSRSPRAGGVGLGLSLSREIVRAHGGTIELEQSDGTLTQFLVTLPSPRQSEPA